MRSTILALLTILLLIGACTIEGQTANTPKVTDAKSSETTEKLVIDPKCKEWLLERLPETIILRSGPRPNYHIMTFGNMKFTHKGLGMSSVNTAPEEFQPVISTISTGQVDYQWLSMGANVGENVKQVYGEENWRIYFTKEGTTVNNEGFIEAINNKMTISLNMHSKYATHLESQEDPLLYEFKMADILTVTECKVSHWNIE